MAPKVKNTKKQSYPRQPIERIECKSWCHSTIHKVLLQNSEDYNGMLMKVSRTDAVSKKTKCVHD